MLDESTIIVHFDEPLDAITAEHKENFIIEPDIQIFKTEYREKDNAVLLRTGEHVFGTQYRLRLKNIRDQASNPNTASSLTETYSFEAFWEDRFDANTLGEYSWTYLQGPSNHVRRIYDDETSSLLVLTGDDTRIRFTRKLPKTDRGRFSLSFTPLTYYPDGGAITLYLKQDELNYYSINNTDGYGPGIIRKVVNGAVVDSLSLKNEYQQNRNYDILMTFQPAALKISAFNENILLDRNIAVIRINRLEIQLTQQDVRFESMVLSRD